MKGESVCGADKGLSRRVPLVGMAETADQVAPLRAREVDRISGSAGTFRRSRMLH
jgi:hypothetical protein